MKLTLVRSECGDKRTCPTINLTDRGTIIVQGYPVVDTQTLAQLNLPPGEAAVEIPLSLLPELSAEGGPIA